MAEDNMLAQILPEVHSIFSDEAVETDLTSIKKIKKTCADTKHIVANREMEIKDIVRGVRHSHGRRQHIHCIWDESRTHALSPASGCLRESDKSTPAPHTKHEHDMLQGRLRLQLQLLLELLQDTRCSALILMGEPRAHLSL
jgi:hypothetical protein